MNGFSQLECTEELGDVVRLHDMTLAPPVYLRANVPNKVVAPRPAQKTILYSKKIGFQPDWATLRQHIMRTNPEKGAEFATQLANDENGPLVDRTRRRQLHISKHDTASDFFPP